MIFGVLIKNYKNKTDGATAIEFGLLMLPFFILVMGIIEISMYYASGIGLEGAALGASRVIRTGQAQQSGDPETVFRDALCDEVGVLLSCDDITYETIVVSGGFSSALTAPPDFDEDGNLIPAGFNAGQSDDVVLIRLGYRHDFLFPFLGALLEDGENTNSSVHVSTVVLRTEPYDY